MRLLAQSYDEFAKLTSSARACQIAQVRAALPGVSDQTIRLALGQLKLEGRVTVDGVGRGAKWSRED